MLTNFILVHQVITGGIEKKLNCGLLFGKICRISDNLYKVLIANCKKKQTNLSIFGILGRLWLEFWQEQRHELRYLSKYTIHQILFRDLTGKAMISECCTFI